MTTKLRVFISSTMKDLRNERQQLVDWLESPGFEPVNNEEFNPNGQTRWARIGPKIGDCYLFAPIIGDNYGWMALARGNPSRTLNMTLLARSPL